MEIIGHRGASYDAPENTLGAIKLAWSQGADAVEVDVQLSKDGQVVVIHDNNTRRTAGRRRKVAEQTVKELKELDAGTWKDSAWNGEKIPLLSEALELIPRDKRFFIEVKCGTEFIPAFEALRKQWDKKRKQLVLIGFSHGVMEQVKRTFPELEVCWIVEFRRSLRTGRWAPEKRAVLGKAIKAGLDGIDVGAKGPLTKDWISQVRDAGLSFYVWTVDKTQLARRLAEAGVDGITTNRPGWLRETMQNNH